MNNPVYVGKEWAGIAQSVQRLSTCWTVRDSNLGAGDIFRARPDRSWGPPNLLYNEFIHSFSILSDDRSKASSKTMPPHSAI